MNRKEIWMPVKDYINYEVSNFGRVRSLNYNKTGQIRIMKPKKNKNGYYCVGLRKDGKQKWFFVHRLVYEAFCGKIPEGMVTDHVDGCKTNNNLSNLRCVTPKENTNNPNTMTDEWRKNHAEALRKLAQSPEWRKKNAKSARKARGKSIVQIDKQTGETIKRWECIRDVERELGICQANISKCCIGKYKSTGGYRWMFFMPPAVIYDLNSFNNLI